MMKYQVLLRSLGVVGLVLTFASTTRAEGPSRPNIVVILADDLGFSDLGCYGGEIKTPNLDALAAGGLRFTQFHNTARCWPSRAALLTGYYAQQVRRDTVPGVVSGNGGTRPKWAKLLPEMLRPLGYRSYHSGKWHIDGMPLANGFDHSYLLRDEGRYFHPGNHLEVGKKLAPVALGDGYYSSIAIADHGIANLNEHAAKTPDKPFFLYMAFTAPHFPLQALPEDIARYRGKYREGWDVARAARSKRVKELGIVESRLSSVERQVGPPYAFPKAIERFGPGEVNRPISWSELNQAQRDFQSAKMEIHAAMVDRMDREIGRVIDQLKKNGVFENTLILFMSDNGASAEMMVRDDGHDPSAPPGSAATHLCLGPGWSSVANTPFRRHKTWVHEGGIATPLVVHWPKGISAQGDLRHDPSHLIDVVPTVLQIAGGTRIEKLDDEPVPVPPGKSLVPAFVRDGSVTHDDLYWEHEGNRAIRVGDWKLVAPKGEAWELFDMNTDQTETQDLASSRPEMVQSLALRWQARHDDFQAIASKDLNKGELSKKTGRPTSER